MLDRHLQLSFTFESQSNSLGLFGGSKRFRLLPVTSAVGTPRDTTSRGFEDAWAFRNRGCHVR